MPFTVSCAACNSRFLLGDDLFQRKVSGKVVTVKCRTCNADIPVDATEAATLPSNQAPAPRPRPAPPRPKHKQGDVATATPMPATATPMPATATPMSATATPRLGGATLTPLPAGALLSIWDAAERSVEAPRKAPPRRPQASARVREAEFIEDIEEAPPSSSDAPTLSALKIEVHPPRRNAAKAPDDFLVSLSAGSGGILGAPTIDVMGLASPPPANVEDLLEVEATELTPRQGTLALFDMSAVLPVANAAANSAAAARSPSHVDSSIDVEIPQTPSASGKPRERKYVIAPETREATPAPKTRRAGAAVWFVLVAAAASVLLVVGLRHGSSHPASPEPQPAARPAALAAAAPASDIASAVPAVPAVPAAIPAASASTPVATAAASPSKPSALATPTSAAPSSVKIPANSAPTEPDKPKGEAAPAIEKPVVIAKPTTPIAPRPEPAEPGTEFDRSAAIAALKAAAAEAAACRKDGDPSGTASLTITFAPSGRVTSANIQGPPFAGTPTGGCIANAMRHAHVPAFSGERVTVNKTIVVQ